VLERDVEPEEDFPGTAVLLDAQHLDGQAREVEPIPRLQGAARLAEERVVELRQVAALHPDRERVVIRPGRRSGRAARGEATEPEGDRARLHGPDERQRRHHQRRRRVQDDEGLPLDRVVQRHLEDRSAAHGQGRPGLGQEQERAEQQATRDESEAGQHQRGPPPAWPRLRRTLRRRQELGHEPRGAEAREQEGGRRDTAR
jgi:hypothetical protein